MKRDGTESCPPLTITSVINTGAPPMTTTIDTGDICCVALELSKTNWVCAFAVPGNGQASVHKIKASDVDRLISILNSNKAKAEHHLGRPLQIVLCYEVGLMPRRGRRAKTDRLDAEGMTRTLRTWLSGDREVARDVLIPSVDQEDAKRIERERKYLVEERTSIVGRIKGLLALHGIWLTGKRIGKGLRDCLDTLRTGDGRLLAPFLRRDIERMLCHYDFVSQQIEEVIADRKEALADKRGRFPHTDKVHLLATLGAVGETTATVLVAEVFHRSFETRRHVASFVGLAPSPYNSGETDRNRGISKAGTKLARHTLVELAWSWLRYQPSSKLSLWWHERFGATGMRGRKVGIVALARKLVIALWRFVEQGVVPEGATLKVQ
jgi:transposase